MQELQQTLRQYEDTFQRQSSRINDLSTENESLKESHETLQDKVECDCVELAALKLRVERLTDCKNTQSARLEELGDQLSRSRRQLTQREAELMDIHESAREVLESQIADLKKRCAVLEQEAKETQHKLKDKVSLSTSTDILLSSCICTVYAACSKRAPFFLLPSGGGHC